MLEEGIDDKNTSDVGRGLMDNILGEKTMRTMFGGYQYEFEKERK